MVSKLHAILRPFVLRRLKSDVEIDLPSKMEVVLYAGMSACQKKINQQLLEGTLKVCVGRGSGGGGGGCTRA